MADAAYWNGSLEKSLSVMERAYVALFERGDDCGAALVALLLQLDHRTKPALSIATVCFGERSVCWRRSPSVSRTVTWPGLACRSR